MQRSALKGLNGSENIRNTPVSSAPEFYCEFSEHAHCEMTIHSTFLSNVVELLSTADFNLECMK
eukprot:m.6033 g.6033  ORF g.6033 m.6033 type:complete len:64 (+) comp14752_c0_seq1:549-740(+)